MLNLTQTHSQAATKAGSRHSVSRRVANDRESSSVAALGCGEEVATVMPKSDEELDREAEEIFKSPRRVMSSRKSAREEWREREARAEAEHLAASAERMARLVGVKP